MPAPMTPARLKWQGNTPWSEQHGDIYHSQDGGPGQSQHVFLAGNDLPQRWHKRDCFVILETGFGTGLNLLTTWLAWQSDPQACTRLHYISAEKHPFNRDDLAAIHARWPQFDDLSRQLLAQWPILTPGFHRLSLAGGRLQLTLLLGDALESLPQLSATVDAFYLDGFAPDKNPDLWGAPVLSQLARLATPDASLATWCVTGALRRGLQAVGFQVEKAAGFGSKREMLRGHKYSLGGGSAATPPPTRSPGHALVIGAGVAGCAAAFALCQRGWQVTLLEQRPAPAQAASGNLAGIVRPVLSRDDNLASRFTRAAYLYATRIWPQLPQPPRFEPCGVLHLAQDEAEATHQQGVIAALGFPAEYARWVDAAEASTIAGRRVANGGWYFSAAGWAQPASLCHANLQACGTRLTLRCATPLARIEPCQAGWLALDAAENAIAQGDIVILAGGADMIGSALLANHIAPLRRLRGQVSLIPGHALADLRCVVCRDGYTIPPVDGWVCTGASYDFETDTTPNPLIHASNLQRLESALPGSMTGIDIASLGGRIGFRAVAADRMPLVGPLDKPGLYALLGLASRGLVWSQLAGELLACQISGEPLPIETALLQRVLPERLR